MRMYLKYSVIKYAGLGWALLLAGLFACNGKPEAEQVSEEEEAYAASAYRFDQPDQVFELPDILGEISGLATVNDGSLLCNEDETGHLYLFDLQGEEVSHKWSWGEDGDYEGVATIGETAYVLKSNGNIYEIRNYASLSNSMTDSSNTDIPTNARRFKTGIDKSCDAEGLCRLPGTNSLLIACKEGASELRTIYQFTPSEPGEGATPFLELDLTKIENQLLTTGLDRLSLNLQKLLDPQSSSGILFPSGIAVHPVTQDLYVLSSMSKLLVVYSLEGNLKQVVELHHEQFLQPESISFTPNADLYIGNEAKGERGNIMKFTYVQE